MMNWSQAEIQVKRLNRGFSMVNGNEICWTQCTVGFVVAVDKDGW